MPASNFDTQLTLQVVKQQIYQQMCIEQEKITNDVILQQISNPQFNWDRPAKLLNTNKRSLKRWVSETYQRQINQKLTYQDQETLTKYVKQAYNNNYNLCNKDLQLTIKSKLIGQYHWQCFYTAFTNTKRQCIKNSTQINSSKNEENNKIIEELKCILGFE
ncbi:Conserved_hypothetical protein [Hexamita inflata]|uniref:Uncharacterized protein n=1 Tax=Hexamita inflata TaxID=28002 RepID=A0AA86VT77_9EUKA|nr:Conserved hypothetical protein [Hexamita inflata]CAI9977113.1 Conserved hypothetical protein [Hexamita inflata]